MPEPTSAVLTVSDAGRLIVRYGRAWIHGGAGPTERELERGARCVATDPNYRREVVRDALVYAEDAGDVDLAARILSADTVLALADSDVDRRPS